MRRNSFCVLLRCYTCAPALQHEGSAMLYSCHSAATQMHFSLSCAIWGSYRCAATGAQGRGLFDQAVVLSSWQKGQSCSGWKIVIKKKKYSGNRIWDMLSWVDHLYTHTHTLERRGLTSPCRWGALSLAPLWMMAAISVTAGWCTSGKNLIGAGTKNLASLSPCVKQIIKQAQPYHQPPGYEIPP